MLLWVWVERRSIGKLTSVLSKGSGKNCIIVKRVFCLSYFKLALKTPFLSDNAYLKCTKFL